MLEITKPELFGGLAIMGSIITALWVLLKAYINKDKQRLEKYEQMTEDHQKQILELSGDYRELKGHMLGKDDGIAALAKSVIEQVNSGN